MLWEWPVASVDEFVKAKDAQEHLEECLRANGLIVKREWSIARSAASDIFKNKRYAPRLDLAVGPFNETTDSAPVDAEKIRQAANTCPLIERIRQQHGQSPNRPLRMNCRNPRCLLAIEIEFSSSSKYMLGDFTNAGMMGLIGLVIGSTKTTPQLN